MVTRVMSVVAAAALAVLVGGPAGAQSPAPSPMPWEDYRHAAQAFEDVLDAPQEPLTLETLMARFDEKMGQYQGEAARLASIVADSCYADAHAEYSAYWHDYIANATDARPMVAQVDSVMGVLPIGIMIETIMAAAHPSAYVDDAASMTGKRLDRMRILDTLQTCVALATPSASPAP